MLVRLLTDIAGSTFYHRAGNVIEMDDVEAARYIKRSWAELPQPEAATVEPPLRATRPEAKKRKAIKKRPR